VTAAELEEAGLDLERAIHRSIVDEASLYAAMRARFEARLADAALGATDTRIIRNRMAWLASSLKAERTGLHG
jgi:hypothetical protein